MTSTQPHSSEAALATLVVRGGVRRPALGILREVVKYRRVAYALVRRAITTRYRQSVGGLLWILVAPLSSAAAYTFFLGEVAGVTGDSRTSYILFALVGQVAWGIFQRGGIGGITALVSNSAFVKKVYFPRVLLPLSVVGQSFADLVPATVMMFVVALIVGESVTASWVLIVVPFFIVTLFAAAFAMAASAVTVYVRDLNFAAPLITQFGMLASAVVYPLSAIPDEWRTAYAIFNPIAGAIDNARAVVYRGEGLDLVTTLGGLAWTTVLLLVCFAVFSVLERNAADRI